MIPVYVPSKGRSGSSSTLKALRTEGLTSVTIVTPPSEQTEYRERYDAPGWSVIPQRAMGIAGARQTILETARERANGFIWMLDDDITAVHQRVGAKYHRMTFTSALASMEAEATQLQRQAMNVRSIGMAGPQFRHRAWSGPDIEWDVHLRNFILMTPWQANYWEFVKEDLDMVLQMLRLGWNTLRFNSYAFDSPTMGTLAGGCRDDYAHGALELASYELVKKWPDLVSLRLNPKTGYIENRVNWKRARA